MTGKKPQHFRYLIALLPLLVLVQSCTIFESIDRLRQEADQLLVDYPKTNYKSVFIDFTHTGESRPSQYQVLTSTLQNRDFTFIQIPEADPNIGDDTALLAALRQDIGVLILPEPNREFSEKELRALELFVVFGGRIITTAPPAANITTAFRSLLSKFGMGVANDNIAVSEPMYFPETEIVGQPEPNPSRGHIMTVEEEIQTAGFHDFDQVVMLFPDELTFDENHRVFKHTIVASKNDGTNKNTVIKATSKLTTQEEKGHLFVIGDFFMAKTPTGGGTTIPDRSAYQGGMITSGNFKFLVNAMTLPGDTVLVDGQGPTMDARLPELVLPGVSFLSPGGSFVDLGGIARISYRINGSFESVALDAFVNRNQRSAIDRSIPASRYIRIPEAVLNPGRNTLQIKVVDQFLNESLQSIQFDYGLRSSDKHLVIASKFPDSDEINPEMGVDAMGTPLNYPNRATFGGPLTESFWDGPEDPFCQELGGDRLSAFTIIRSAPQGVGRVVSMLMPATQGTVDRFNTFSSLITFHFDTLTLDNDGVNVLNHAELRTYENDEIAGLRLFTIAFGGTPIITAPMNDIKLLLTHNAPRNCNDDVINFTSSLLPSDSMTVLPNLPTRENDIAEAFLADLAGTRGIRYRGTVFNRIIHGSNSELRTPEGTLRYPIGVPHPDPTALGLDGFARIEIIR